MINKANNYNELVSNISRNYGNIIDSTNKINSVYDTMMNDSTDKRFDFSGNLTNINTYNPSIQDAVMEDTSTLAYAENSIYILGSMTAAVMLIIAVYIARE